MEGCMYYSGKLERSWIVTNSLNKFDNNKLQFRLTQTESISMLDVVIHNIELKIIDEEDCVLMLQHNDLKNNQIHTIKKRQMKSNRKMQ